MMFAGQGRKYLDYDLEALYAHFKPYESKQVIVAFQDSEAFDTGLLSDLITLFRYEQYRLAYWEELVIDTYVAPGRIACLLLCYLESRLRLNSSRPDCPNQPAKVSMAPNLTLYKLRLFWRAYSKLLSLMERIL